MFFSIIVPVYNRPHEVKELLESLCLQEYKEMYEILIVEDGSTIPCKEVVDFFKEKLSISYFFKPNSGPGDSRNFGMKVAKGDYFILFDSDCIVPPTYLTAVSNALNAELVDCFGGPDRADQSFTNVQKAINFAMTSFMTTGGVRGGSEAIAKFEPRSFNMGLSKKAFLASNGFSNIHPGEDPDLSIRLWALGFKSKLIPEAYVYHKRRIDWGKFSLQVKKFGKARPILNFWHPKYKKLTYFFPSLFMLGFFISVLALLVRVPLFLEMYAGYFVLVFLVSSIQNKNLVVGFLSMIAVWKQFFGYGWGFLTSFLKLKMSTKSPEELFPELFFKVGS
jgi:glycosyltransferase involved in cell wall biosynthesis